MLKNTVSGNRLINHMILVMNMAAEQKIFLLRVDVMTNNIQTSMKTQNVTPQEAIGFLEMAKDQILDNLKQGRKDIFQAFKKEGDEK